MSADDRPPEIVEFEAWLHKYVTDNHITPGSMNRRIRATISNKAAQFGLEINHDGTQYKLRTRGTILTPH